MVESTVIARPFELRNLNVHDWIQTGEKRIISEKFETTWLNQNRRYELRNLNVYVWIHTGENTFAYVLCNKTNIADELKLHG